MNLVSWIKDFDRAFKVIMLIMGAAFLLFFYQFSQNGKFHIITSNKSGEQTVFNTRNGTYYAVSGDEATKEFQSIMVDQVKSFTTKSNKMKFK